MIKLEDGTEIRCLRKTDRYFTQNKIYKVRDSDLTIGRIWVLSNENFLEMLDRGEWEVVTANAKLISSNWGAW
jgi:hypothetical protein